MDKIQEYKKINYIPPHMELQPLAKQVWKQWNLYCFDWFDQRNSVEDSKFLLQITNNEGQMLRTNPADVQHSAAQLSLGEGLKHDNSEFWNAGQATNFK